MTGQFWPKIYVLSKQVLLTPMFSWNALKIKDSTINFSCFSLSHCLNQILITAEQKPLCLPSSHEAYILFSIYKISIALFDYICNCQINIIRNFNCILNIFQFPIENLHAYCIKKYIAQQSIYLLLTHTQMYLASFKIIAWYLTI